MNSLFQVLFHKPRTSLAVALAVVSCVACGGLLLEIDFSPEQVYVGEDDAVAFCEEHKKLFRFEDSLVLVVLEAPENGTVLTPDCLNWLNRFAATARRLDGVRDVTSLTTLERPRVRREVTWTPLLLPEFYDDREYIDGQLERIPLLNDTLISADGRFTLTLIDLDPSQRKIRLAAERVRAIANSSIPDGYSTFVSGVPAIRVDVIDSIIADQFRMVPVCSTLFFVVSVLMFRSLKVTLLSLFSALSAVALTLGLMGFCGVTFSVMSNVIPALLLIIGAANNVHILSRFQVEVGQSNSDLKTCAAITMHEMSRTCALTLATTGIGFGSLLIARAQLLQSLALQAACGMACCYVGLMIVMPPTLILCGPILSRGLRSPTAGSEAVTGQARSAFWNRPGRLIARYPAVIVGTHIGVAITMLVLCRNMQINSYMFETYDNDHPTMQSVRKLDDSMSGLVSLEIQIQASVRDRLFDEDLIVALSDFRQFLGEDPTVTFCRDYIEFLSVFDFGRALDSDPAAAAASLQRVRLALRTLDRPEATSVFLAADQPVARVMMRIQDVGSAGMKELIDRVERQLETTLPADIDFRLTGDAYLHAICMDAFTRDLFYSLLAASGVIFLLITVLFGSLRIGLISAIPNMFPLIMTLGYMHFRGYELTAGNVIVFAISLGIAVDDTIHFLARFRDECHRDSSHDSVQATLATSGRAILLTSVLVVSGLSVLIFSDFVPTRRFAELTAVTMCAALPGDVILLPALLQLFSGSYRQRIERRKEADTGSRPGHEEPDDSSGP
ncbi:MAG: MMPL family transporter [Planctomycetaceae bacterium]|nr:MMPL family transporter [Planctomycetaceae bacterium]